MTDEGIGLALDVDAICAEQLCLDGVKARHGVRPGVDLRIKLGNKAGGKDFRTLPAGAGRNPCLPGSCEIVGGNSPAQFAYACQGLTDAFSHIGPVALRGFVKRRSIRTSYPCPQHNRQKTYDGPRTACTRSQPWQRNGHTVQGKIGHVWDSRVATCMRDHMPRVGQYCPISLLFCDEIASRREFPTYSESFCVNGRPERADRRCAPASRSSA